MKEIKLSARAQKLWEQVQNSTKYYVDNSSTPQAMRELEKAGLVATMGRVTKLMLCFVPAGSLGCMFESYPDEQPKLRRSVQEAPIRDGWYYARLIGVVDDEPEPYRVSARSDRLVVYGWGDDDWWPIDHFEWFGPVPKCEESGND